MPEQAPKGNTHEINIRTIFPPKNEHGHVYLPRSYTLWSTDWVHAKAQNTSPHYSWRYIVLWPETDSFYTLHVL